ncbi:hypothetical protein ASPWEDRAFT_164012 [Aspergillus wentii DTO 134E9]|uniref:Fatty acid hydroxylase domain-containing protein n=1 Tax=Aspergillus wentii DTO 134E9 TaxID=1073089 RepID=A0A1L9R5C4_ASPWE|nr:uncharacterized protein ASPWEDRAFT_164012 [Aspergillus wentii DTO 134E9]KAI9923752.1 hypothetical protein MW887_008379 [Aspergillus wentii]OJJ30104.1 hypothetical protein ASPWEDRAFT_164012 [Aspergillus wentii DTO 134E9]
MSFLNNTIGMGDALPPLPSYTLTPRPSLIPGLPDELLKTFIVPALYWISSGLFHLIDALDLFPQYRLHEPEELQTRNRVTIWQCIKQVVIQQASQIALGLWIALKQPSMPVDYIGKEDYDIAFWAQKLRLAQRMIPSLLALVGIDSFSLASKLPLDHSLAGLLSGGKYPWLTQTMVNNGLLQTVPAFTGWELLLAKVIYWAIVPTARMFIAVAAIDLWQYVVHRTLHRNKWLYSRIHAVHHRLYVPYALGALYNHPLEGFFLDTVGAILSQALVKQSIRERIFFYSLTTVKSVGDHSGYLFPFDPLQMFTPNNTRYHDIHHQSWGIKHNFSQPYLVFWDRYMGTEWKGDATALYEKGVERAKSELRQRQNQEKEL